jgi:hypothetical protein
MGLPPEQSPEWFTKELLIDRLIIRMTNIIDYIGIKSLPNTWKFSEVFINKNCRTYTRFQS